MPSNDRPFPDRVELSAAGVAQLDATYSFKQSTGTSVTIASP
jgi:hypothetical protein